MNEFCELYWRLDSTTKTLEKVKALKEYFAAAPAEDAAWAIYFLVGERIKRLVPTKLLRQWAVEEANITPWLFEECYDRVGDLAETISLVINSVAVEASKEPSVDVSLRCLIEERLLPLRDVDPEDQQERVVGMWRTFDQRQTFVLGKLMTGGFRVGVSKKLVARALAEQFSIEPATIAHRMMGNWNPDAAFYKDLLDPNESETAISKPYPFFLANPLKDGPDLLLAEPQNWIAEWKWDGIRAQVIRREGETFIWSRGEELVTEQFPEIAVAAGQLPDGTVIDGEIVGWEDNADRPMEFSQLQRRLGRKRLGKKLLTEVPVVLLTFDMIEEDRLDIRELPLEERRTKLSKMLDSLDADSSFAIRTPPQVTRNADSSDWTELANRREEAKQFRAEGLMLKRISSSYQVGRPTGDWWKWKVDPYTIDAVLIYAQRGHGRRASLYTDYTFAVWKEDTLVPFAKAYSGLTDSELRKVDAFVRKNTKEKFGPVRSVTPELVFELAFENVQKSKRHKSGVAVRFPRISRWRHDKKPVDADSLDTIMAMLGDQV